MGLAKKYSPPSSLKVLSCSYHLYSLLLKTSVYHLLTLNSLITFQSSMDTRTFSRWLIVHSLRWTPSAISDFLNNLSNAPIVERTRPTSLTTAPHTPGM